MSKRLAAYSALAVFSMAGPVLAQADPYATAHAAMANQLGVMEYCQGRGDVGPDAVIAQRSASARLPASTVSNEADEALGKEGTLESPNGTKMTLDSIASAHGVTVSSLCKQMGSSAIQSAAAVQQNRVAPGGMAMPQMPNGMAMPQMPNGTAMPQMPNGMAMPQMPNGTTMPNVPAVPPH